MKTIALINNNKILSFLKRSSRIKVILANYPDSIIRSKRSHIFCISIEENNKIGDVRPIEEPTFKVTFLMIICYTELESRKWASRADHPGGYLVSTFIFRILFISVSSQGDFLVGGLFSKILSTEPLIQLSINNHQLVNLLPTFTKSDNIAKIKSKLWPSSILIHHRLL